MLEVSVWTRRVGMAPAFLAAFASSCRRPGPVIIRTATARSPRSPQGQPHARHLDRYPGGRILRRRMENDAGGTQDSCAQVKLWYLRAAAIEVAVGVTNAGLVGDGVLRARLSSGLRYSRPERPPTRLVPPFGVRRLDQGPYISHCVSPRWKGSSIVLAYLASPRST